MVLNDILDVLTTGCRWIGMLMRYDLHEACWKRLKVSGTEESSIGYLRSQHLLEVVAWLLWTALLLRLGG